MGGTMGQGWRQETWGGGRRGEETLFSLRNLTYFKHLIFYFIPSFMLLGQRREHFSQKPSKQQKNKAKPAAMLSVTKNSWSWQGNQDQALCL